MTQDSQGAPAPRPPRRPGDAHAPQAARRPEGAGLLELVAIMDRLRTECPWDAKQTHASLAPFLLEETYEALEALENDDLAALREELGDVLLQVLFHARVASERTDGTGFTIDDVADGIASKLVRRHPHVFSDVSVSGADEVKQNWDTIKAAERETASGGPGSALDGVPFGQPALALAAQLQRRAARAGVPDELAEIRSQSAPSEIGAQLFALAGRAAAAGLDPELELRSAARAYRDRVLAWERALQPLPARGRSADAGGGPGPKARCTVGDGRPAGSISPVQTPVV